MKCTFFKCLLCARPFHIVHLCNPFPAVSPVLCVCVGGGVLSLSYVRDNQGSDIFRAFFFTQGHKIVSIRQGFYFSTVFLPLHKLLSQERYPRPSEKSWHERIHLLICWRRKQCSLKLVTMIKLGNVPRRSAK